MKRESKRHILFVEYICLTKRVRYLSDLVSNLPDGLYHFNNLVRRLVPYIALNHQRIHRYLHLHIDVFGQSRCQTPTCLIKQGLRDGKHP